jgi:hypothetical protein
MTSRFGRPKFPPACIRTVLFALPRIEVGRWRWRSRLPTSRRRQHASCLCDERVRRLLEVVAHNATKQFRWLWRISRIVSSLPQASRCRANIPSTFTRTISAVGLRLRIRILLRRLLWYTAEGAGQCRRSRSENIKRRTRSIPASRIPLH